MNRKKRRLLQQTTVTPAPTVPQPTGWWRLSAVQAFLVTRLGLILLVYVGLRLDPKLGEGVDQPTPFGGSALLDGWTRWDGEWYWKIIRDGYFYTPGAQSSVAYFPGYPLLAKTLSLPFRPFLGPDPAFHLAAILLSLASFLAALLGLERLCAQKLGEAAASRTVWLLALFPFSYFFGATYTEGLFLALAVWSFVFASEGRFGPACFLAGLATGVRSTGALLGLAIGLEYLRARKFDLRALDRSVFALVLLPLGLGLYTLFLALKFSDPLVFLKAESAPGWNHSLTFPSFTPIFEALLGNVDPTRGWRPMMAWYAVLILCMPVLLSWCWRRLGAPLTLFAGLSFCSFFFSGNLVSTGRYLSTVFPLFMVLGERLHGRVRFAVACATFALSLGLFAVEFSHGRAPI
jgi:hypothetical protein